MLIEEKMYRSSQPLKISYPMTAPSSGPPLPKSRGLALFDRQAANLNPDDQNETSSHSALHDQTRLFPSALKPLHSFASSAAPISSVLHHHQTYSPIALPRRLPTQSPESYPHSSNENVQLLRIQPRPELTYIKELPPKHLLANQNEKLLETDFPLTENTTNAEKEQTIDNYSLLSDTACAEQVEQAFDYLASHENDDDDDDVIHQHDDYPHRQYSSDSFDDENQFDEYEHSTETIDRSTTNPVNEHHRHQRAADLPTNSFVNIDDKTSPPLPPRRAPPPTPTTLQDKLINHSSPMATALRRGTTSEDIDSDFDDSSPEDEDQLSHKESITELEDDQQAQIQQRQQQILWGIIQEWGKKEQTYSEDLERMEQQLKTIPVASQVLATVHQLVNTHKTVLLQIEDLWDRGREPIKLIECLTKCVGALMSTIRLYEAYIQLNLASTRKALEKKLSNKDMSSEDFLSIPPKQFLQILSQVQDLYQTAQMCETSDKEHVNLLYDYAQRCKGVRNEQNENMNKIILKAEDVVVDMGNKNRDRCRLILYSDAIVCCNWKTKLLASPKYTLIWFIPMADLEFSVPQDSGNNSDTGDELKSHLKNAYRERESVPKTSYSISSRLSKNIRKQENEYNLAQSKLQLILTNKGTRIPTEWKILFSSNYQRQDWLDMIDKSKQDFDQRTSATLSSNLHPRLNDSLIQKRLDLVKLSSQESISADLSSVPRSSPNNTQIKTNVTPVTGTLQITIQSIQGPALCNPVRQSQTLPVMPSSHFHMQNNFQFFIEIEIDSYNTFYPCAKTSKQNLQQQQNQQDFVKFKDEAFQIELEHASAFRLLVYRIDTSISGNNNSLERNFCLAKFHREIHDALASCNHSQTGTLILESRPGDLSIEMKLTHSRRDGTFKRQPSRRTQAIFGKTIENLMKVQSGLIDGIPRIIVRCVRMVEEHGLDETGIYRVCCVTSDLQKLRNLFDRNSQAAERSLEEKNVHVAANLLKLFFRELPEPLFTTRLYQDFVTAIELKDVENQQVTLINTLNQLSADYRRILLYLFDHLIRVSDHSNKNMMHLDNLAVVFGPTLMRPSKLIVTGNQQRSNPSSSNNGQAVQTDRDQMSSELQSSMKQCQIVLACLKLRKEGKFK